MKPERTQLRWNKRHESVLKCLLRKPWLKQKECAVLTNYSATHISRIVNTEEFSYKFIASLRKARMERLKEAGKD